MGSYYIQQNLQVMIVLGHGDSEKGRSESPMGFSQLFASPSHTGAKQRKSLTKRGQNIRSMLGLPSNEPAHIGFLVERVLER